MRLQIVEYYPFSVVKNQMMVTLYTANTYLILRTMSEEYMMLKLELYLVSLYQNNV